jgi:potassium efflux system protein
MNNEMHASCRIHHPRLKSSGSNGVTRRLCVFVAGAVLISAQTGLAQQSSDLTMALIDERLATLASTGPTDTQTRETYEAAKELLIQAESHAREAAVFVEALSGAPLREAEIQLRLDEIDETYDPAEVIDGFTPEELAERLALTRSEQQEFTGRIETLDRRLAARETNTVALRTRLQEIDQSVNALPETLFTGIPDALPSLVEAREWRNLAARQSFDAERRAKEAELASKPARFSVMVAQRAELTVNLARSSALIRELETRVSDSVKAEVVLQNLGIDAADPTFEIAGALVDDDADLRSERLSINERLTDVRGQIDKIAQRNRALEERANTARRIVDFAGDSDVLGRVLLTYWKEIEQFVVDDPTARLSSEVGSTVIRRIGHEETLAGMLSATAFVNGRLREANLEPESIASESRDRLFELATVHRERLRGVIAAQSEYIEALGTLESRYAEQTRQIEEYREFLQGLVLWIPDHPPLWELSIQMVLVEVGEFRSSLRSLEFSVTPTLVLALLATLLLIGNRRRFIALQGRATARVRQPSQDAIRFTLLALAAAAMRASPVAVISLGLASGFDGTTSSANLVMGRWFALIALLGFWFSLIRIVCEPSGIGRFHFGWQTSTMENARANVTFLLRWVLPMILAATLVNQLYPLAQFSVIARILLLIGLLVGTYQFSRLQYRQMRSLGSGWLAGPLNRLRLLLVGILLATLILIVYGQLFSVTVLIRCLLVTAWIGIGLLLVHAVLIRWLAVAGSNLRRQELLEEPSQPISEESTPVEEQVPDISDVSTETRQLINLATVVTALLVIFYIWSPLLPALEVLSRFELWTSTTEVDGKSVINRITLSTLLAVALLIGFTLFTAKKLPALIEIIMRSRTSFSPGARYAVSTLLNYLIIGAGSIAGLSALGLNWGQMQWLVAALGVGIGFGLQEIVANFISGLIILFERPIRVGDIITIGDKDGLVLKIRIRATTIRDWDGKELLVPNKEFITGRLLNWTLSDSHTRLVLPVGIAYGSNVEKALRILTDVVASSPAVLTEPAPSVLFLGFGDNSLNLVARCFISKVDARMPTTSELNTKINAAFEEAGITIAFPQRDVHLDSAEPLRIAIDPPPSSG